MSKFRRFAPIEVRFLPFGYFPVDKNREEIRDFRIWEGGKIRIFGQNIYPWSKVVDDIVRHSLHKQKKRKIQRPHNLTKVVSHNVPSVKKH